MLNLTIISFSLSFSISCSPLLCDNMIKLRQINFKNFYFPIIFYNPKSFQLRESIFSSCIGSLMNIEKRLNPELTFIGKLFDDNNKSLIQLNVDDKHVKDLVMILNCIFLNIKLPSHDYNHIKITNQLITFYMDGCNYINPDANNVLFHITTRATTFSHICCSELQRTIRLDNVPLFVFADIFLGSFIKIIDSTFFGTYEKTEAHGLFYLKGKVSVQFNNLNASKFWTTSNRGVIRIESCQCTNIQMSTFQLLYADQGSSLILYIQPIGVTHKINLCNFLDNKYTDYLFFPDLNSDADVVIYKTVFAAPENIGNTDKFFKFTSHNSILLLKECSFESNNIGEGSYTTQNCNFNNPQKNNLKHYLYENICQGPIYDIPQQCPDDICSEDIVCGVGAFDFKDDDIPYPPTSDYFTESFKFSDSNFFSRTTDFSYSNIFSNSLKFSLSDEFTKTNKFSSSFFFSNSKEFTQTTFFSPSYVFSNTGEFTKTGKFSESTFFSDSGEFSSSFFFSNSVIFSKTNEFSDSLVFSNSVKFTETQDFSYSLVFSNSGNFTKSLNFLPSKAFSNSEYFTKTNQFSETGKFSETSLFSNSYYFSESCSFKPTLNFNESTPSNEFTFSKYFSESITFSQTDNLTRTVFFTKTNNFSSSDYFSISFLFTKSNDFSDTNLFSRSAYFSQTENFSTTNSFTKSSYLTKSNEFTNSDPLNHSKTFFPTKVFSKSNDFLMSNNFTLSLIFSFSDIFNYTKTFGQNNSIIIDIKSEDSNKISTGIKVGIGVAAGLAAISIVAVAIIFLRKRNTKIEDFNEETFEINNSSSIALFSKNPLRNLLDVDDPFEDEFD